MLRQIMDHATSILLQGREHLCSVTGDKALIAETPLKVQSAINIALESISDTLQRIQVSSSPKKLLSKSPGAPTRQQGQFLAFIREFIMRNQAGVAPSHADLQRFFDLTPPSVNSMLIRLEQRGFIRRIPGKARAIEITVPSDLIPTLDRPFKF